MWVCELGLWRAGERASGRRPRGEWVCVCVCACWAAGAGPRRLRGRGFPAVCVWGGGPVGVGRPLSGVVLPLRGRGSGASQVRTARPGPTSWTREGVRPPRRRASWRRGLGPRLPRLGPRQEARRPAARPNRLRARPPLARSPSRPPASPDAPGTPCSREPWALPRAWPGEGRGRDTRMAVACAASASPRGRQRRILAF